MSSFMFIMNKKQSIPTDEVGMDCYYNNKPITAAC